MKKGKKVLSWVLLVVFLVSTGYYVRHLSDTAAAEKSHSLARSLADSDQMQPPVSQAPLPQIQTGESVWIPAPVEGDAHLEALAQLNLESLRQINPQVVGWIRIPDTPVDYPVVQGSDNRFYLDHTWDKQRSDSGAVFMEATNQKDMAEFHTILYGHNMRNGTMFASIREYRSGEYLQQHPYVYLLTEAGVFRYEIYSAYLAKVNSMTYQLKQQKEETRAAFLDYTMAGSVLRSGIVPTCTDRILTLSTCSGLGYSTRWVIHARLPMVESYVTRE